MVKANDLHLTGALPTLPAVDRTSAHSLKVLEVEGLTFRYPNSEKGVRDIDLRIERGSFTVVTGRIGSGKTTLLRALLGLVTPNAGMVSWNGEEVTDPAAFFVPPRSAYTPQVPQLFSMSLRDNLLLGIDADDDELAMPSGPPC